MQICHSSNAYIFIDANAKLFTFLGTGQDFNIKIGFCQKKKH